MMQILFLRDELKTIKTASSLKLENIIGSIQELEAGLKLTNQEIEFARDDVTDLSVFRSRFLDSLVPFYEQCFSNVVELKELLDTSLMKLKNVCEYFGENGDEQPQRQLDLFKTLQQFLNMFDLVSKQIQDGRHFKHEPKNDATHSSYDVQDNDGKSSCRDRVMGLYGNRVKVNTNPALTSTIMDVRNMHGFSKACENEEENQSQGLFKETKFTKEI